MHGGKNVRFTLLAAVAFFALGAAPVTAQLELSFHEDRIAVVGIADSGEIVLIGSTREGAPHEIVRVEDLAELLEDSDGDEIEELTRVSGVPTMSVWVAVSRADGNFAVEAPPNYRLRRVASGVTTLSKEEKFPDNNGSWTFQYLPNGSFPAADLLYEIELPTLGLVKYEYGSILFLGSGSGFGSKYGIEKREMYGKELDGSRQILRRTSYDSITGTSGNHAQRTVTHVTRFSGANPVEVDTTIHSFWDQSPGAGLPHWAHGLPIDFNETDGTTGVNRKYRSTRVHENVNDLKRTTFRRYTADDVATLPFVLHANQRLVRSRTVFHTDSGYWIDEESSDFNGLGSHRVHRRTPQPASGEPWKENVTNYSVNGWTYDYDAETEVFIVPSTWSMLPTSSAWILGVFDLQTKRESGETDEIMESCFNDTTGFLERTRTLSGTSRAVNDIVRVRTPNADGNLLREQIYGGDGAGLSTTQTCAMALPGTDSYRIDHQYQWGSRSQSRYRDANGGSGSPVGLLDFNIEKQDIDRNTGLPKTSYDISGFATDLTYDVLGRPLNSRPQGGLTTGCIENDYTPAAPWTSGNPGYANVLTRFWSGSGCGGTVLARSRAVFNGIGELYQEGVDVAGHSPAPKFITTTYNARGWKASVSQLGHAAETTQFLNYDAFGRPRTIRPPDGSNHDVTLAYVGIRQTARTTQVATVPHPGGGGDRETASTTTEFYDGHGRLVRVQEPSGAGGGNEDTFYSYDAANRLRTVQMGAQLRRFTYDGRGFMTKEEHPERALTDYEMFDALGNPATIDDGIGPRTIDYDRAGRAFRVSSGGSVYKELTYGWTGNDLGRLKTAVRHNYVDWHGTGTAADVIVTEDFTYDGRDRKLSKINTDITPLGSFVQHQTYTELGDIDQITYPCFSDDGNTCVANDPEGPRTIGHAYDLGFLTSIQETGGGQAYASDISYHSNAVIHKVTTPSSQTPDYYHCIEDGLARPASISLVGCNSTKLELEYDGAGNVKAYGDEHYHYDEVSRILKGELGTGEFQTYSYDIYGNLLQTDTYLPGSGTPDDIRSFSVQATTNRTSLGTYDAAGNMLSLNDGSNTMTMSWDPLNIMTERTQGDRTERYVYSAGDERLAVRVDQPGQEEEILRLRSADGLVLRDYRRPRAPAIFEDDFESGNTTAWDATCPPSCGDPPPTTDWTFGRDNIFRGPTQLASEEADDSRIFYYPNHLGTPIVTQDDQGGPQKLHFLLPYGETHSLSVPYPQDLQFTGHERDRFKHELGVGGEWTSMDYMHARYCSAWLGRFFSVDPKRSSKPLLPQTWNRNSYARNNPIRYIDPDGREEEEPEMVRLPPGQFAIQFTSGRMPDGMGTQEVRDAARLQSQAMRLALPPGLRRLAGLRTLGGAPKAIGFAQGTAHYALQNKAQVAHAHRYLAKAGLLRGPENSPGAIAHFKEIATQILENPTRTFDLIQPRGKQAVKAFVGEVDGKTITIYVAKEPRGRIDAGDVVTAFIAD